MLAEVKHHSDLHSMIQYSSYTQMNWNQSSRSTAEAELTPYSKAISLKVTGER